MLIVCSLKAEELIRYGENGNILGRYDCDKVAVHESSHQNTIICSTKPKIAINIQLRQIFNNREYQNCSRDVNCVVLENNRDPNWSPVALYGIPNATFGRYANGNSCIRIQETVPNSTTWARETWRLCTDSPDIELGYTYALGHSNEGLAKRFKDRSSKRTCFADVLRGYPNQRFWVDNCIFVRQK